MWGNFVIGLINAGNGDLSHLRGWPKGRWWDAPCCSGRFLFRRPAWTGDRSRNTVGALCLGRTIAPAAECDYTFCSPGIFRTARRQGAAGRRRRERKTRSLQLVRDTLRRRLGTAQYVAENLERLERKTRQFTAGLRESTLRRGERRGFCQSLDSGDNICFRTPTAGSGASRVPTISAAVAMATAHTFGTMRR